MVSQVSIPHPALQEFVISIQTVDAFLPEGLKEIVTPYPPTTHQSLMFYGEDFIEMQKESWDHFEQQPPIVIVGPQYTRVNLKVKRIKAVRVDFHPGGLYRLLGLPMTDLFDGGFNAGDLLGVEMRKLNDELVNLDSVEKRKQRIELFLLQKLKTLKQILPFDFAMRQLILKDGNIPIEKIASLACLSLRQFERKCAERIGMPAKVFARIARFSKAYRLKETNPHLTWTAIAYESGYFDQMHLIRDFKEFAGVTPRIIEEAIAGTPFRMQADLIF